MRLAQYLYSGLHVFLYYRDDLQDLRTERHKKKERKRAKKKKTAGISKCKTESWCLSCFIHHLIPVINHTSHIKRSRRNVSWSGLNFTCLIFHIFSHGHLHGARVDLGLFWQFTIHSFIFTSVFCLLPLHSIHLFSLFFSSFTCKLFHDSFMFQCNFCDYFFLVVT